MRYKIIIVAMLAALIPLTGFSATENDGAEPVVYVPEPVFEFDKVVDGSEVVHDFIVQNKGDATLDITKVRPG